MVIKLFFIFSILGIVTHGYGAVCDAENAERWEYLWRDPALSLRQRITAELAKEQGIATIIEVGGFCTPVCNFAKDIEYVNIDPFVHSMQSYECNDAKLIKKGVEKVVFAEIPIKKPYAVVIIGLYWEFIKNSDVSQLGFIHEALKEASLVVIENVDNIDWLQRHREQIISYAKEQGMHESMDFNINILGPQTDAYAFYRHMSVLRR